VGTRGTNVWLPDTDVLIAEFGDEEAGTLAPVVLRKSKAQNSLTNEFRFDFDYGAVVLEPPPGATVSVAGRELKSRPVRRFQRSGEPVNYMVSADHFNPATLTLAVKKGETLSTNIQLVATLYDVFLEVSPPVAQARLLSSGLVLTNGLNRLPWGPSGRYEVAAAYPRLDGATSSITIKERGVTQALKLNYTVVSFTTRQRGIEVSDGKEKLGAAPLTNLYLRPGTHKFTATSRGIWTTWITNLENGAVETIPLQ
jgi:hypothetical protein